MILELRLEDVLEVVSHYFSVSKEDLLSRDRTMRTCIPRQVMMCVMYLRCRATQVRIGAFVGGRNHATVSRAIHNVWNASRVDLIARRELEAVLALVDRRG